MHQPGPKSKKFSYNILKITGKSEKYQKILYNSIETNINIILIIIIIIIIIIIMIH